MVEAPKVYGDYRIVRVLGRGGMGVVYEAEQPALGRRVALKVLVEEGVADPVALGRLRREALAMGALQHPHIVGVSDFSEGPPPFMVMELLTGRTLRGLLAERGTTSTADACLIALQLLSALGAAHRVGIVHRDVKPANVFVVDTPLTSVYVKLLDFGIAKLLTPQAGSPLTSVDAMIGSVPYMAPEQIRAEEVDAKTDLFAVGVTLYEMLAGVRPFVAAANEGVLMAILRGGPIAPLPPSVPRALEAVILRAVQRAPSARYLTAAEMATALLPFVPRAPAAFAAALTVPVIPKRALPDLAAPTIADRTAPMTPDARAGPSSVARTPSSPRPPGVAPTVTDAVNGATVIEGPQRGAPSERDSDGGPPRSVGRFRIESLLGEGGMASVYRAFDPTLDRFVAVKVLHAPPSSNADASARLRKRIVREARAAAALTHPNTVTIYEVGEADGQPFIAMELLEGETLRHSARGTPSVEKRLQWLLQAARALTAAHARGLVHRDVKPDNMFVEKGGRLKLLDFGIAKRSEDDSEEPRAAADPQDPNGPSSLRTVAGQQVGTPRYMAPEQRAGESSDARTDQYAWGLVAFELLTGALPTTSEDVATTFRGLDLPEAVGAAIARALAARKEDRAPSLELAIDAIERSSATLAGSRAPLVGRRVVGRVAAALVVAGVIGVVGTVRWRSQPRSAVPALPPSRCAVVKTHAYTNLAPDGLALLSGGTVLQTFDLDRRADVPPLGVAVVSQGDAGVLPSGKYGALLSLRGAVVRSATAGDEELFVAVTSQRSSGGPTLVSLFGNQSFAMGVHWVDVNGFAASSLGKSVVVALTYGFISTSSIHPPQPEAHATGLISFDPAASTPRRLVERYLATGTSWPNAPVVAVSRSRVATVFREGPRKLVAVFVDLDLAPAGDPLTILVADHEVGPPAAAYLGDTLVVVWAETVAGKTRLRVTRLVPGASAFEESAQLIDEPVTLAAPAFVSLPDGGALLTWTRVAADGTTVRAARFAPALAESFDLGRPVAVSALSTFAHGNVVSIGWVDAKTRTVTVADVTCASNMAP